MLTKDGHREMAHRWPWLYHVVHRSDDRARETVASDGLAVGQSRRRWHPLFEPRPGHVYLATHGYLTAACWNLWCQGDDLYAVSTRHLVAARINPDEDHFSAHFTPACDQFRLPPPAGESLWKLFPKVVPSFGAWADQVDLGSDPAQTAYSVRRGSLAYCGVVPPTALQRWDGTEWIDLDSKPVR